MSYWSGCDADESRAGRYERDNLALAYGSDRISVIHWPGKQRPGIRCFSVDELGLSLQAIFKLRQPVLGFRRVL